MRGGSRPESDVQERIEPLNDARIGGPRLETTSAWLELDSALRIRLHEVLAKPERPVTEPELRKLTDEGRACSLILHGELQRLQGRLGRLDGDPSASLGEIADAFRRVHEFRAHVDELDGLLAELAARAREVRTAWRRSLIERP